MWSRSQARCGGLRRRLRYRCAVIPAGTLDLFARLVACDTSGSGSTRPAAEAVADRLDAAGARVRLLPSPDGRQVNLRADFGPPVDPRTREGLLLCGHLDVVPAGEPDWSSDPFELVDRGDRWVGRGACDMKGFVALATTLAAATPAGRLRAPLALLFTYDEEVGMQGARDYLRRHAAGDSLPRATVIGEPTSLEVVRLHKGHLKLRVSIAGRASHSGTPQHGDNAIERMAPVVEGLAALRAELAAERPPLGEHFPEAPFVPLNVARIEGGVAINVVPDRCAIELGFRPMPGSDVEALRRRVEARIRDAAPGALVEAVGYSEPLLTDEGATVHRELCALVGQGRSRGAPFATDGGPLSTLGLDVVIFGPGSIEVAHRADEFLPKAELERCGAHLAALVDRCCGPLA